MAAADALMLIEEREKKTPWASPGRLFSANANSGECYCAEIRVSTLVVSWRKLSRGIKREFSGGKFLEKEAPRRLAFDVRPSDIYGLHSVRSEMFIASAIANETRAPFRSEM